MEICDRTGAKAVAQADPAERLEVSVLLRRNNAGRLQERVKQLAKRETASGGLSREEFNGQFGASGADISAVKKFAAAQGLSMVQEHAGRRTVVLSGTVAQFQHRVRRGIAAIRISWRLISGITADLGVRRQ
ncbi:protease pro-enzyme activation domain-containing protein [Acidisphaera sp. S103]|uniref:protease pro-enzyme activation domain-containing protein n=1 Tax=Acidisphaera sp. S103 TaxID=1747223 RepID=UPI00131DF321|nr:protease pro-enzyme activation domain-containing protein [Acidisphaera sp. S103]